MITNLFSFFSSDEIENKNYGLSLEQKLKDYTTKNFAVFQRFGCPNCGLFSFYIIHLGCIKYYLSKGYIPIVDLQSFKNRYNLGNTSIYNLWELFFYQPYNYTLEEVKKYAKNIKYYKCNPISDYPPYKTIYNNKDSINFWHNLAKKYMPIKNNIMKEVKIIMKNFFGNSKNILGVMIRGTEYTKYKPKNHPIPPPVEKVIHDVKKFDKKYKYDFIFFATEDGEIRNKFISAFDNRLKIITTKDFKLFLNYDDKINKIMNYMKNYLLNIIILSKCLDIITSRTSGGAGIYILTEGFRHNKVYYLGYY